MAKKHFEISGLTAELTAAGIFKLEGEGDVPNFIDNISPWFKDGSKIKTVIIGPHVKSIGKNAFENCSNLETIITLSYDTVFKENAFTNCPYVKNIVSNKKNRDMFLNEENYIYFKIYEDCYISVAGETGISIDKDPEVTTYTLDNLSERLKGILSNIKYFVLENANPKPYIYDRSKIEYLVINGKKNKLIGSWAFSEMTSVKRFFIPKEIEDIHSGAFARAKKLKKIEFAKDITLREIPTYAFLLCGAKEMVLPESLTDIYHSAFYGSKLEKITFLNDVNLDSDAFNSSRKLKTIEGAYHIKELGQSAFQNCVNLETYEGGFADNIKVIPKNCFKSTNAQDIIPFLQFSKVEVIETGAFTNTKAEAFIAPPTLTEIERAAFEGSTNLKNIDLSLSKVKTIGRTAFAWCGDLQEVKLPKTISKINSQAFYYSPIENITFPENLKSIGNFCFTDLYCDVKIPSKVKALGDCPISNSCSLSNIDFSENKNFVVDNGMIYDKELTKVIGTTPALGKDGDHITVPNTVKYGKHIENYSTTPSELTIEFPENFSVQDSYIKMDNCNVKLNGDITSLRWLPISCKNLYVKEKDKGTVSSIINSRHIVNLYGF